MVELALTMKVKLTTNKHESEALNRLCDNYTSCCNEVSDWIGEHHTLSQRKINEAVYHPLRDKYGLLAQMTQSSIRRVIASYKAIHSRMDAGTEKTPRGRGRHTIPPDQSTRPPVLTCCGTATTPIRPRPECSAFPSWTGESK